MSAVVDRIAEVDLRCTGACWVKEPLSIAVGGRPDDEHAVVLDRPDDRRAAVVDSASITPELTKGSA